jgi:hypothetical protein
MPLLDDKVPVKFAKSRYSGHVVALTGIESVRSALTRKGSTSPSVISVAFRL